MAVINFAPSKFFTATPAALPGTYLLFSAMSGSLLELCADEWEIAREILRPGRLTPEPSHPSSVEAQLIARLVRGQILVPHDFDEYGAISRLRQRLKDGSQGGGQLTVTIAPTMQCNFRCTYCFEEHRAEFMPRHVEDALVSFLNVRAAQTDGTIGITWFGGEPLLYLDCIERVQTAVNTLGARLSRPVTRGIVTNGYLLSERVVERMKALGDWSLVQITIDGSPMIHDGRRPLAGGRGTFARIVANVSVALDMGLPVVLRMNVDTRTRHSVRESIKALKETGLLSRTSLYLASVQDSTAECSHVAPFVVRQREWAQLSMEFNRAMLEEGLPSGARLPKPVCHAICTADAQHGYVVAPSGLLFKCWNEVHLSGKNAVGALVGPQPACAEANSEAWSSYDPLAKSGCKSCHALPVCMGGCPWDARHQHADADHGHCGAYKFFPRDVVRAAHAELLVNADNLAKIENGGVSLPHGAPVRRG